MIDLETFWKNAACGQYLLRQMGSDEKVPLIIQRFHGDPGWEPLELLQVLIERTTFLYRIIPCEESKNALYHLEDAVDLLLHASVSHVRLLDVTVPGHCYQILEVKTGIALTQPLRFLRRNSKAITHASEWPGVQSQEVLRALIHFFDYNMFSSTLAELCRKALWEYEARAYRRKRQEQNRQSPQHEKTVFPYSWEDIETKRIGKDGHIQYLESEVLYHATFGACDAEPIPGVNPFQLETDPVYRKAEQRLMDKKGNGE